MRLSVFNAGSTIRPSPLHHYTEVNVAYDLTYAATLETTFGASDSSDSMSIKMLSTKQVWKLLGTPLRTTHLDKKTNYSRRFMNTSAEDLVVLDKIGAVTTIGINRPDKRNCVNTPTAEALVEAFRTFEKDDSSSVAVLHGTGGNFCAGYDLQELSERNPLDELTNTRGPMGPSRMLCKKPVVAAIDGYAVAGGMELALMCDLRVMEETAVMGVFCRRFGVPLIDGGTVRLPMLIGLSRALDLILTGRPIKAKEAFEWGLVNRLVACGTAFGQAINLALSIAKFPQECLKMDRLSAYNAVFDARSLEEALEFEFQNAKHVIAQESIRGAGKFLEGVGKHGKFHLEKLRDDS